MNDTQITQLLQDLVRLPSVNPAGDPGTTAANTGEAQVAAYVAEFLRKLGLDVATPAVAPERPNVIGKFVSRGSRRRIALAPHTDTVSVIGMTVAPFAAEIRDGKLYGRGACDTKGSLAAFLAALANLTRDKSFREGAVDVDLCALMGEEAGNDGARALADSGYTADLVIAGEPTDCRVVYAHKGALWLRITTPGRTAHGSTPQDGDSAIAKMAGVVTDLLGDYARQLGNATVNVGLIRGGSATNIVPNHCEIHVDRRLVPGETIEQVVADLRRRLAPFAVTIEPISQACPPLHTDPAHPLVQQLAAACAHPQPLTTATWFCDAAIFATRGIPAVAFGPGFTAQAHQPDEYVELAQVHRAARITEQFLRQAAA